MTRAIELASSRRPHPNPRVGAVVLDASGAVVGEGAHQGPGMAHAEPLALDKAGEAARGGTLIVTLEPCNHRGRTPPCVGAIIAAGVRRVVIGAIDPDPRVAGSGIEALRRAGIEVSSGHLAARVEANDPAYFHHRRRGRCLVTLKAALTLDGQTAAADGSSKWITGELARRDAHRLRAEMDAVMVGAGTVLADDPLLDVRIEGFEEPQPRPVIVAGRRLLPQNAKILTRDPLIYSPVAGDNFVVCDGGGSRVDLAAMLADLGERGMLSVLVEGGARLASALWDGRLVDRGVFYLAPRIAGGVGRPVFDRVFATFAENRGIEIAEIKAFGTDLRVDWKPLDS